MDFYCYYTYSLRIFGFGRGTTMSPQEAPKGAEVNLAHLLKARHKLKKSRLHGWKQHNAISNTPSAPVECQHAQVKNKNLRAGKSPISSVPIIYCGAENLSSHTQPSVEIDPFVQRDDQR